MSTEADSKKLKTTIGVLIALVVLLGIFTLKFYFQGQDTKNQLTGEKEQILFELNEMKTNYDKVIQESGVMSDDLMTARNRIEQLIDSVKTMKADVAVLSRYRQEVFKLKKEREELFKLNDSLRSSNYSLTIERDSTAQELQNKIIINDSLTVQNDGLKKMVEVASVITISNLKSTPMIVRSSGKTDPTDRARRADKLNVCFTLTENKIAPAGDKLYYVQIIDPKNNLMGEKNSIEYGEATLYYSTTAKAYYDRKNLDVCVDVLPSSAGAKFEKGLYVANIFDGPQLLTSKTFELK